MLTGQQGSLAGSKGEALADVVVQIARETLSLVLLRLDEQRCKDLDFLLSLTQLLLPLGMFGEMFDAEKGVRIVQARCLQGPSRVGGRFIWNDFASMGTREYVFQQGALVDNCVRP